MNGHDPEAVRRQLDKILASGNFVNADRLCRFLRFTVEAKLKGEEGQIKEYVLGREVFDRDGNYDPRMDPIVRVEARRMRVKLDEYYDGPGRADPIRIEFPKGSYAPVIQPAQPVVENRPVAPRRYPWRTAVRLLVLLGLASIYYFTRPVGRDMIAVVPQRWLLRDAGDLDPLDESVAEAIAAELANRQAASVIAWPSILRYRSERKPIREMAGELGVAKALIVTIRNEEGWARATVFFVDTALNQKLWVADYRQKTLASPEAQRELARRVADEFESSRKRTRQ
jgi:TolB-like protein